MKKVMLLLLVLVVTSFSSPVSKKEKKCMRDAFYFFVMLRYQAPEMADVAMETMKLYVMRGMDLCEAFREIKKLPEGRRR